MSQSGAIEIIAVTGEAFTFGPASEQGAGEPIAHSTTAAWTQWLEEWFGNRFNTQVSHWEAVLTRVGPWQPAMTPAATFGEIAAKIQAGALEARRLPPPSKPKAAAPVGVSAAAMRSQEAGGKGAHAAAPTGSASKGIADEDMGPDLSQQQCQGDPVAPVTGEEILTLEDFHLAAPMPLTWQRWYRSRHSERDLGLGAGWFAECLRLIWQDQDATWLLDQEARPVCLPLLAPGEIAWQAVGGQRLERRADNRILLTESDGRVWTFVQDQQQQWRPVSVLNQQGHQWRFLYDKQMRLARLELSPRKTLAFTYGRAGKLHQIHLLQGSVQELMATYEQDAEGNLVAATTHQGTERYGYQQHQLIRRQLPSGYLFLFHWDGCGPQARCLRSHGEDGRFDYRFEYQPKKYQTRVTDGDGHTRVFHYDAQDRIVARQDADGGVHQWAYEDKGRLAAYRLPDGRTTRYGYDSQGRKIRERYPDGREHRWYFNELGACTAESLPDGRTLSRRFDLLGRLVQEQRPDGSQWRYRYDPQGWLKDAISSTGEIQRTGFSDEGELLATVHQGHLARQAYDEQGRLKGRLQADRVTEYDYNGQHLRAIHQYPQQAPDQRRSRFYQYDPAGRLTRFTTATGDSHGFHYDGLAQPTAYHRPDGKQVRYQYDKEQRLTDVIRPDGQQWSLGYNSQGQVNRCQAPDGRHIHFNYDAAGDIIQRQQADDWVQHLKRDAGGRILHQQTHGRDRQSVEKTFQYDQYGRRTSARCDGTELAWHYDAHNRVTQHRQNSHTVDYSYGAGQQLKKMQLPDGTRIEYDHDRYGRWQSLRLNGEPVITRELDAQGREQQRTAGHNQQTQTWDRFDCLEKRQWQGRQTRHRHYHWDAESRLTHFTDEQQSTHQFHRDPQGQLCGENGHSFHYDDGGNRLPELPSAEPLIRDQLQATPDAKRRYDSLGAEIAVLGTTIEHRHFDAEGQLVRLKRESLEVHYGYDALGRRSWRKS
ncbi:MAG: RHS repeat protein, partial [Halomonadaceae bacterium]